MKVLGIDPGLTIGVSYYDSSSKKVLRKMDEKSPLAVAQMIDSLHRDDALDVVVIEDILGQGMRSNSIVRTIKVLGFLEGFCHFRGIPVELQAPQFRIHRLEEAKLLVPQGHHYLDATAHALAYCGLKSRRENPNGKQRKSQRPTYGW